MYKVGIKNNASWHSGCGALCGFVDRCGRCPDKTAVLPTSRSRKADAPSEPLRRTFLPCKKVRSSGSHQIKTAPDWVLFLFGGREWIRTTEARRNRFTVCPLWPLGNSPVWSWRTESNHQPADYKSAALPLSHASILTLP